MAKEGVFGISPVMAMINDLRERGGTPEFWEEVGFVRNWGDCAIMRYPLIEILRRTRDKDGEVFDFRRSNRIISKVEFVIVGTCVGLRDKPWYCMIQSEISDGELKSWGSY